VNHASRQLLHPLFLGGSHQQARIRGARKIQIGGGDDIVTKITQQAASYRVNVLVEQKSHEGTPTPHARNCRANQVTMHFHEERGCFPFFIYPGDAQRFQ